MTKESIEQLVQLTEQREKMENLLSILNSKTVTFIGKSILCGTSIFEEDDKDLFDGIRKLVQAKYDSYNKQIEEL